MTIKGNLLLEKNPMFNNIENSLGSNCIQYMILSCFDKDDVEKFKRIITAANGGKPLEDRMSFPVGFDRGPCATVMCKFRNPKPETLLKRIDFSSGLRAISLRDWIGKEFNIRVSIYKYNFIQRLNPDLLAGGSSTTRRGYTYHIKSIKLVNE